MIESSGGIDLKVVSGKLSDDKEVIKKTSFSIIDSFQKDKDFKKSGDIFIKYLSKTLKQLSEVAKQIEIKLSSQQIS